MKNLFQNADWNYEKHVPVIELPDSIKKGDIIKVKVIVGKQIAHPNTTEHHIRWIDTYFLAEGDKFPFHIGRFSFDAHGESTKGPNIGGIYTHPEITFSFKTDKSGTIFVSSFCNIHGLWENSIEIRV